MKIDLLLSKVQSEENLLVNCFNVLLQTCHIFVLWIKDMKETVDFLYLFLKSSKSCLCILQSTIMNTCRLFELPIVFMHQVALKCNHSCIKEWFDFEWSKFIWPKADGRISVTQVIFKENEPWKISSSFLDTCESNLPRKTFSSFYMNKWNKYIFHFQL